ncbi:hypothetical protein B0H11DRAFT_2321881 [Mycena galericulata]|nr:hypothetical protein B0H11DRAFT_2321881 [Mycena galericulata]
MYHPQRSGANRSVAAAAVSPSTRTTGARRRNSVASTTSPAIAASGHLMTTQFAGRHTRVLGLWICNRAEHEARGCILSRTARISLLTAALDVFPASSVGMPLQFPVRRASGARGRGRDPAFIEDEYDETGPEALTADGAEESEEGVEQRADSETDVAEAEMESAPGADADAPAGYVVNAGTSSSNSNSTSAAVELAQFGTSATPRAALSSPRSRSTASARRLEPPGGPLSVWRTREVALRREPRQDPTSWTTAFFDGERKTQNLNDDWPSFFPLPFVLFARRFVLCHYQKKSRICQCARMPHARRACRRDSLCAVSRRAHTSLSLESGLQTCLKTTIFIVARTSRKAEGERKAKRKAKREGEKRHEWRLGIGLLPTSHFPLSSRLPLALFARLPRCFALCAAPRKEKPRSCLWPAPHALPTPSPPPPLPLPPPQNRMAEGIQSAAEARITALSSPARQRQRHEADVGVALVFYPDPGSCRGDDTRAVVLCSVAWCFALLPSPWCNVGAERETLAGSRNTRYENARRVRVRAYRMPHATCKTCPRVDLRARARSRVVSCHVSFPPPPPLRGGGGGGALYEDNHHLPSSLHASRFARTGMYVLEEGGGWEAEAEVKREGEGEEGCSKYANANARCQAKRETCARARFLFLQGRRYAAPGAGAPPRSALTPLCNMRRHPTAREWVFAFAASCNVRLPRGFARAACCLMHGAAQCTGGRGGRDHGEGYDNERMEARG